MTIKTGFAALAIGLIAITPAMAQTTAPGTAGSKTAIPEKRSAPLEGRSESLSHKLDRSDGVIAPKGDIDPGMRVPAPDPRPGTMSVIPPSATGGNSAK